METLSLLLALAGTLATASGCSLRYDPEDLGDDGGETDDGAGPDAGPDDLFVNRVFPPEVFEGQGFALDPDDEPEVRAIPMVLYGQNMTPDTRITVSGDAILSQEVAAQVSDDGRYAAFELRVPVIEEEGGRRDVELVIAVAKGDETHQRTVVHHLLPEYELDQGGNIMTDDLDVDASGVAHFSSIRLRGIVGTIGSAPLRLVGYSGISVTGGLLWANGNGPDPGAGGCGGGAVGQPAACGGGSGQAGGTFIGGGGGGGGAFGPLPAATEGQGPADDRGQPGDPIGVPSLVPMPPEGVKGSGGGGGGEVILGDGGAGGGSGGVIELTTPGLLRLSGVVVSANGAEGGGCVGGGGGGGGGSGGAVMLRAGSFLAEDESGASGSATLQALGGTGGTGDQCNAPGGEGSGGLIRFDLPQLDGLTTEPGIAFAGPAFLTREIPVVTTEAELTVAIRGTPGTSYELLVASPEGATDAEVSKTEMVTTTAPDGVGEKAVVLWQGFNRLCLRVVPNADPDSYPEAANCLTVAYIQP